MLKAGAKILVPHPSEGFVGATVESAGAEIKCQADDGERLTVDAKKVVQPAALFVTEEVAARFLVKGRPRRRPFPPQR